MNSRLNRKKNKPRQCSIPEEYIKELADELTHRFMTYGEIIDFMQQRCHKRYEVEGILCILEARMFLVTQEIQKTPYGKKTCYCIMTKEKYQRIEEEHRENAKRRLLAAVSY